MFLQLLPLKYFHQIFLLLTLHQIECLYVKYVVNFVLLHLIWSGQLSRGVAWNYNSIWFQMALHNKVWLYVVTSICRWSPYLLQVNVKIVQCGKRKHFVIIFSTPYNLCCIKRVGLNGRLHYILLRLLASLPNRKNLPKHSYSHAILNSSIKVHFCAC